MPYIELPVGVPGIRGPMVFSPETARPLNELVNVLLQANAHHPDSTLSEGERELIATYVSAKNDCFYCQTIHGAVASHHLGDEDWSLVRSVKDDYLNAAVSSKLKALLTVAGSVQQGGKNVTAEQIDLARTEGATDRDIHDTVLIAAAFCMFNRYVDGLATVAPVNNPDFYRNRAAIISTNGYAATDIT
ncbi:carboxymuconolactone decarboxylase family protein [Fibrella forsythiae]|uniref:Carboxymuconolactone decarboxylase family protein n=1 Tax=Fibrella forsythiae TaxID=2817061 RepID=A0ABS3JMB7_9BACT|nr:carboxymuconolactone decarboxylase family protein [Fibrella forsythiae]MBO0951140.1 carboxymuconolactone decarboxylase family protein [Fibrella forsythiae]